ncbi:hypothetical protein FHW96_002179 [Novosphingobium sp. SG751A]|uniref:cystatin domain-containing protein n=1 Tax=Novosphingobium sp. SG751A TaxID=2587000 RepID=UPI0015578ED0|nr:cystatin domain-containing protein [Novosphingobium sp. SG751A]NOW46021.1 hypothetical protein [Novosphingobium sp. SG751A]
MKAGWAALLAGLLIAPASAQPIAGGWSAGQTDNPEVREAARFAAGQLGRHARLAHIDAASRQVVAGMNYRLTLRLTNRQRWEVTVWRQLDGTMKLSGKQRL